MNFDSTAENRQEHLTVECPDCGTRFVVNPDVLQGAGVSEKPFFHCSKCDYVFSDFQQSRRTPVGKEPADPRAQQRTDIFIGQNRKHSGSKLFTGDQIEIAFKDRDPEDSEAVANSGGFSNRSPEPSLLVGEISLGDLPEKAASNERGFSPVVLAPDSRTGVRNFLLLLAPFVITAAFAGLLTLIMIYLPAVFKETVIPPVHIQHPPKGVFLTGLAFQKIVLGDGTKAALIRGDVINDSFEDLRHVQVKGVVYNKEGGMIGESSGILSSKLKDVRNSEEVLQIVNRMKGAPYARVKAGDLLPFAAVVRGADIGRTVYYQAKILSFEADKVP